MVLCSAYVTPSFTSIKRGLTTTSLLAKPTVLLLPFFITASDRTVVIVAMISHRSEQNVSFDFYCGSDDLKYLYPIAITTILNN